MRPQKHGYPTPRPLLLGTRKGDQTLFSQPVLESALLLRACKPTSVLLCDGGDPLPLLVSLQLCEVLEVSEPPSWGAEIDISGAP
jgi:hypothetical protein